MMNRIELLEKTIETLNDFPGWRSLAQETHVFEREENLEELVKNLKLRLEALNDALDIIFRYGGIDGEHHKQWVLDQVVKILTGTEGEYKEWIKEYRGDWLKEEEMYEYEWEEGIIP